MSRRFSLLFAVIVAFMCVASSPALAVCATDTITMGAPQTLTATEGQQLSGAVATFSDLTNPAATASDFAATIDWGDGQSSAGTVTGDPLAGFEVSGAHSYASPGSFNAVVSVSCGAAGGTVTDIANVVDALISATGRSIGGTAGSPLSGVVASFTDADPAGAVGEYTATIDWGDGSFSPGSVAGDGSGGFLVSGTHTYGAPGSYPLAVAIHDVGGAGTTALGSAQIGSPPTVLPPAAQTQPTVVQAQQTSGGFLTLPPLAPSSPLHVDAIVNSFTVRTVQHGTAIKGTVGIAQAGSAVTAKLYGQRSLLARLAVVGKMTRRGVAAGPLKFAVRLSKKARRHFARGHRMFLTLQLSVTPPRMLPMTIKGKVVLKR